jgi:hypothetical protein
MTNAGGPAPGTTRQGHALGGSESSAPIIAPLARVNAGDCERICERDLASRAETRDTRYFARDLSDLFSGAARDCAKQADAGSAAHNPEVAGSNPAPATNSEGPFPVDGRVLLHV